MSRLAEHLRKLQTWERGMELAGQKNAAASNGLDLYIADQRSPWRSETNANGHYLLKGRTMARLSQDDLDEIAARLDAGPRKILDFDTPAPKLEQPLR